VVGRTPEGAGVRVMRDPFVFWHGGRRYALLGAGLDDGTPAVLLYACDDIMRWDYLGVFASFDDPALRAGAPADIWECPQLVWADGIPVLVLSLMFDRELGDVVAATGSVTDDGGMLRFTADRVELLDGGDTFYAPQLVQDDDGPLMFGWVREEPHEPGGREVSGCLTLPRRLRVDSGRPRTSLDPAARALLGKPAPLGAGHHVLPAAACLEVLDLGEAGDTDGWRLSGSAGPHATALGAPLPVGTQMWVDADVAEVYPGDGGTPVTTRAQGAAWHVSIPAGGRAIVSEVLLPSPG
jgi:beta-fructofuranosidase